MSETTSRFHFVATDEYQAAAKALAKAAGVRSVAELLTVAVARLAIEQGILMPPRVPSLNGGKVRPPKNWLSAQYRDRYQIVATRNQSDAWEFARLADTTLSGKVQMIRIDDVFSYRASSPLIKVELYFPGVMVAPHPQMIKVALQEWFVGQIKT